MKPLILFGTALLIIAAAPAASDGTIQPGQWETTTHFTTIEIPGMPPQVAEEVTRQMRPETALRCITPAEAANPTGEMLSRPEENCRFSQVTFSGGRIHVEGACPAPDGNGEMRLSWEGSYTDTRMGGTITTQMTGTEPEMRLAGTIDSRRIGDCPG